MPLLEVMQKKLREVHYFLRQMQTVARREFGDPEEFEFLLSALLSASRSITGSLESRRYQTWFDIWKNSRTAREQELLEFMRVQRNAEVHQKGADVKIAVEFVPMVGIHTGRDGHPAYSFYWAGPPGTPPPAVGVNVHQFELGGTKVESFGACRDFVAMLKELFAAFESAHPGA